ncbi:hypothetical protein [Streptomyces sp. NPDC006551]|uniref:hypothetical protein n=1 Tax=Streptomyces sp. NPDC006551 TaxID=3157178 RepID=UPI0033A37BD1
MTTDPAAHPAWCDSDYCTAAVPDHPEDAHHSAQVELSKDLDAYLRQHVGESEPQLVFLHDGVPMAHCSLHTATELADLIRTAHLS